MVVNNNVLNYVIDINYATAADNVVVETVHTFCELVHAPDITTCGSFNNNGIHNINQGVCVIQHSEKIFPEIF